MKNDCIQYVQESQENVTCDLCGNDPDTCICPLCVVCETKGNVDCIVEHNLFNNCSELELKRYMKRT
jgi:hypothetical protein